MTEISKLQSIKVTVNAMAENIKPLVKSDTEKFIKIAQNFIEQNAKIQECSTASICSAIMKAAQLNLFIDGNECSLVPFKGSAVMMTGYKGILKLVRNSGELSTINAYVVYEKDHFEFFVDEKGEHILHKPVFNQERGKPVGTYCIARTKGNADSYVEFMTESEIDACKKSSNAVKGGYDTPWNGPFADEMRKKTVIRRISKRLPMSTDMQIAINSDDELFNQTPEIVEPAEQKEEILQSTKLKEAVIEKKVLNETKEESTARVQELEKTFSNNVQGIIEHIGGKVFADTNDPTRKRTRYSCKIAGVFYGTWDKKLYDLIEEAYNKKDELIINFVSKTNKEGKPFNDIISVEQLPTVGDSPI